MNRILLLIIALISSLSCLAEVVVQSKVATEAPIYAGQRVVLEIDALVAEGWVGIKKIELGDVEGAVVLNRNPAGITISEKVNGKSLSGQRKELWVYPQRAGAIVIPAFSMEVETRSWGANANVTSESVEMEALTFEVAIPKGADAKGLIISATSLKVSQQWSGAEEKGVVGDAVTRTILMVADDLPGMLLPPMSMEDQANVGMYPKQPLLLDKMDRGSLIGKRVETTTLVFEAPGTYRIPDLSFQWFDLKEQTLKTEVLKGRTVVISGTTQYGSSSTSFSWLWWSVALVPVVILGIPFIRRIRTRILKSEWMAFQRVRRSARSEPKVLLNAIMQWGDRLEPDFRIDAFLQRYGHSDALEALSHFYARMEDGKNDHTLLKQLVDARRCYLKRVRTKLREQKLLPPLNP